MGRYCDGEAEAFRELYRRVAPRLLSLLRGLVGERAAAEDLLQQTFLKLHEARGVYVRGAEPLPWLYTIARRVALDELRRRRRSKVTLAADGAVPELRAEAAAAGPASTSGAPAAAVAALEKLPRNQREALVLTKIEGLSHAEAAAVAGTSVGAIKLRAHRAYEALRRILKDERP
jgi:RNA polymerase sigma-70 factor (ECF subfamily)